MGRNTAEKIEIEKLAHGGDGLGHLEDGRVVFVERTVPGDVVDVDIVKEKQSWARGRPAEFHERSDARVDIECDAFERGCGGCQFWGVNYESELHWKVDAARESMERISGLEIPEPTICEAPQVRDYRSRVTYHQRRVDGDIVRGFFAQGSGRVVEVEQCPVARPVIDEALAELDGALQMVGEADITVETAGATSAVVLVELVHGERIEEEHLEELARRIEQGMTVTGLEILDEDDDYYVIGDTTVDIHEVLADPPIASMRVESGRFRQANAAVNRMMVDTVRQVVDDSWKRPRILELFCGSGNFTFPLAQNADRVTAFEGSEGAVETARRITDLAGESMEHVRFDTAELTDLDVVHQVLEEPFEVVVLDPPRQGAPVVAEQLAALDRGGQIVYVSCDAACLARDAKTLAEGGWEMDRMWCFDMFPKTAHLETVAVFEQHS